MQYPNIRSLREDHDYRQHDLADFLHVSQNTYSQYENGVIELTAERLVKLADFYDVSIDYLLGRTNNPEVNRENNKRRATCAAFLLYTSPCTRMTAIRTGRTYLK